MKSLLIILIGLVGSWHYTDLSSENFLTNFVAPFFVFIFMVSIPLWFVIKAGFGGSASSSGYYDTSSSFDSGDIGGGD